MFTLDIHDIRISFWTASIDMNFQFIRFIHFSHCLFDDGVVVAQSVQHATFTFSLAPRPQRAALDDICADHGGFL